MSSNRSTCSARAIAGLLSVAFLAACAAAPSEKTKVLRKAREADAVYQAGDLGKARRLYEELIELTPTAATPHVRLGSIEHREGRSGAAREQFEIAANKDPANAAAKFNLAMLSLNDAAKLLSDYVALTPRPAHHAQAADLLARLQDMHKDRRTAATRR